VLQPAVPTTLEEVLDPAWLGDALDDIGEGDRIVAVEEVDSSKTLAQKVRFRVTVERADGARATRAYCVKAHLDGSPGTDILAEACFYGELAPQLDVRAPRTYYTAVDDAAQQAMIIMDDVVANGGRFLSAHTPYSLDTTRDTLGQLARLHAATWGRDSVADLDWLTPRVAAMADVFPAELLQSLLDDGRGPGVAAELRSAENVAEAMRRTGAHEVTCVLHGDPHSGNSYLDAEGRACWLDWQVVQRGNWATDISYHLATVLDIESRRAHEGELLRHYLGELESLGAPAPGWDDAWEQYTLSFSYGYFLWVITRISSRAVVLVHIPRLATALTDHDTFRRLGVV
jgi:aminoglycoside phosphotransferase (APT) family kinase protein